MVTDEIIEMIRSRVGSTFDGEATFSEDEIEKIVSALSASPAPVAAGDDLREALERAMNDLKALTKIIRARGGPDMQDAGAMGEAAWKSIAKLLAAPTPPTPAQPAAEPEDPSVYRLWEKDELIAALIAERASHAAPAHVAAEAQVRVKPLDLSNLLKHAFDSGRGSTITGSSWTDYDPTETPAYQRILSALPTPALPEAQVRVTDEMVLAACRTIYPALFKHGLDPLPNDGPSTRAQMAETIGKQRKAMEAAIATLSSPEQGETPAPVQHMTPDFRALAVGIVDGIRGYTFEFSSHPAAHKDDYDFIEEKLRAALTTERSAHAEARKALGMMLKEHDILSGNFGDVMDPKHKRPDRWPTAAEAARRALEGGE